MKNLLGAFVALVFSLAFAQPNIVISPQSIVINPKPSFNVNVWVDRDPSGESTPSYQIGEEIQLGVSVSESAYVYLFDVRSNGIIDQLLPNRFDQEGQNNFLQAGQTKYFPAPNARYTFNVDGPTGLDKVIAVASKEPLDTRQLADFTQNPNFASSNLGEQGFAETLSIIIKPKPQSSWVTDTALFYVGSRPTVPAFGTLSITSSPSGAEVYVDGSFVGFSPLRFGTSAGIHTVELRLVGYFPFSTTLELAGGETRRLEPLLELDNRGTVYFESNPRGADVYVNGQYYGATPLGPLSFLEGSYEAQFRSAGYPDSYVRFSVARGSTQTIDTTLSNLSGSKTIISDALGLSLYPGANLHRLEQGSSYAEAEFDSSASLQSIFDDLESQLFLSGWQRSEIEYKDSATKVEVTYWRNGAKLELELDSQGNSGRYRLELSF
jgi:hypothetical protein